MATREYRSHIDAYREHAQTFETTSDEDAALLIRFSNRLDLLQGRIDDYRHRDLLRYCGRLWERTTAREGLRSRHRGSLTLLAEGDCIDRPLVGGAGNGVIARTVSVSVTQQGMDEHPGAVLNDLLADGKPVLLMGNKWTSSCGK